jgi:hypothetical protein
MRTIFSRFMVVAAFCIVAPFLSVPAVDAALATCGVGGNWFDGKDQSVYTNGNYYEGVSAVITSRIGLVCDSDTSNSNNFSNAWSMIANGESASGGWVQTGYIRGYGGHIYHFGQVWDGIAPFSTHSATRYGASALASGERHRYWQQWSSSCYCELAMIDVTQWIKTTWNPFGTWTTPFEMQFEAETRYRESDVPGTPAAPAQWDTMQAQAYSDTFITMPNVLQQPAPDSTRWAISTQSVTQFRVWTK